MDYKMEKIHFPKKSIYPNLSETWKQQYWIDWIMTLVQNWRGKISPISLVKFKKDCRDFEENPDRFFPGLLPALIDWDCTLCLDQIFILDEDTQKSFQNIIKSHKHQIWDLLWKKFYQQKTTTIEWVNMAIDDVIKHFSRFDYYALGNYVAILWRQIEYLDEKWTPVQEFLYQSAQHIRKAWDIYKNHITPENIENHYEWIPWVHLSRTSLATRTANLETPILQQFLLKLSQQIGTDTYLHAEKKHPKVAYELFKAAKLIKRASEILEK